MEVMSRLVINSLNLGSIEAKTLRERTPKSGGNSKIGKGT